jgi:prevent-host-death family protein
MKLSAAEFKAKCLKLMDEVNEHHTEVIITKHGKPVAKLIPFKDATKVSGPFGYLKDTVTEITDITKPIDEKWNAELEN